MTVLATRRRQMQDWLRHALEVVDPESATRRALQDTDGPATVIAIGKAAPAMCRGAASAIGSVTGICVTNVIDEVPPGIDLLIGNHPVPGDGSFAAGDAVLETSRTATGRLIALISGGGSALCEKPVQGVSREFIQEANSRLLDGGASIAETNLVRRHLSAIKGGGVARAARQRAETYIISDVAGGGPEVVASGPTIPIEPDPDAAFEVMHRYGVPVTTELRRAVEAASSIPAEIGAVEVLADGRTAAQAVVTVARADGVDAELAAGWYVGDVERALDGFFAGAGAGVTVGAGEPNVRVTGEGVGGRNSHAALLAARRIAGTDWCFAAFATDGVDGRSSGAGAIVDGTTVARGGDPTKSLSESDSATYLEAVGDLLLTGPTGTNVSDLWLLWRT